MYCIIANIINTVLNSILHEYHKTLYCTSIVLVKSTLHFHQNNTTIIFLFPITCPAKSKSLHKTNTILVFPQI